MITALVCLAILAAHCQAFMDVPGLKRVKKDSEFHLLGGQTDHVIVLFTHNGRCDRPGCKEYEDMLTNFYEVETVHRGKQTPGCLLRHGLPRHPLQRPAQNPSHPRMSRREQEEPPDRHVPGPSSHEVRLQSDAPDA